MSKSSQIAQTIIDTAASLGWTVFVRDTIVTIAKRIAPNSSESFAQADGEYWHILSLVPTTRAGSMWGTDGGSVGALSAMKSGSFVMNKSGVSKRVIKSLTQLLA